MVKDYVIKKENLEKTIELIDIVEKDNNYIDNEIVYVLKKYTRALNILDRYDYECLERPKGNISDKKITYRDTINLVKMLKDNQTSQLFGLERNKGFDSIINDLYSTYDGVDVYKSIEEKAANFLYMVVKNHVFIDGNKRIAAILFIYILHFYNILYVDNHLLIDNNTLASITLLIAKSKPIEKEVMIDLIMNFLN